MNIRDKIINLDNRDYHMHTSSYSDWIPTINELVQFAGEINMKEIAITDHSQATIDLFRNKYNFTASATSIFSIKNWWNVYNDVKVIFWVEWDLLDEDWNSCFDIQWKESEFCILSAHRWVYFWREENITNAYINAIKKYKNKIKLIWHPCSNTEYWEYVDIKKLVRVANEYNIPLEFNAQCLYQNRTNLEKLDYLLKNTNKIYINSDAHTLIQLRDFRKNAIKYLEDKKYI